MSALRRPRTRGRSWQSTWRGEATAPAESLPAFGCVGEHVTKRIGARPRAGEPAVFARVQNGQLLLDVRSVPPEDDQRLAAAVQAVAS